MRSQIIFALQTSLVVGSQLRQEPRQLTSIPDYVTAYAPLVYLDQNELYLPSDIQAQLNNTTPELNYTALPKANVPSPLLLADLEQLNSQGACTTWDCNLYLTSKDTVNTSANPAWLYGVLPDATTGETAGIKSTAIIVNDHGSGVVDAYYMYFYAFNLGTTVFGYELGNHVGDWEHSMVRFENGKPISVWLSQHGYGQAFSYDSLSKNGTRPLIYSAIGSHSNYPVAGIHGRLVAGYTINDTASAGPLWDPTLSALYYTYTPSSSTNGTFSSHDNTTPSSWLYYLGRWGDEQYPDSDPRQVNLYNLNLTWAYESGPTGPLDKDLNRTDVCPTSSGTTCSTSTILPVVSGSSIPVTVTRTSSTTTSSAKQGSTSIGASATTTAGGAASTTAKSLAAISGLNGCYLVYVVGLVVLANII